MNRWMNGWRNEWTGGRNCSGYYSFFRPNPISRTGGKSPDALFSLSSSGSVDRCDGPSATWMPPVLASGSWPKQLSMRQKGKTKKKEREIQEKGVPGVVLGEADKTMRWCWSTPVVCILQSNHFLSCPLFFFPPCSFPTRSQKRPAKLSWWSFRLQAGELAHV